MTSDQLVFNGIDGTTGRYLLEPLSAKELYEQVISDPAQKEELTTQNPDLTQKIARQTEGYYGPPSGTNPQNLNEVGWGIIFAYNALPEIYDALKELLDFRRAQAGDLYKEFQGHLGYWVGDPKENHRTFLARQGVGFGPVDPKRVPYYLLIIGDPERIPFQFQYMLDVEYAVGRIYFDTLAEYAQYAHSVVEAERRPLTRRRRVVLTGTKHPGDGATTSSATVLLPELEKELRDGATANGWTIERHQPEQATKNDLLRLMGGPETPALLFTATHGMAFPGKPDLQQRAQGSLVCQEWDGPMYWRGGPVTPDYYLGADDIGSDAQLWGSIFFHFACFGAGTPRYDDFAHARRLNYRETIAEQAFISPLPRRLLGHPNGGPLAVIGHVDRAWTASFQQVLQGVNIGAFRDALRPLMNGSRVGFALEAMNIRFAEIATALTKETEDIKFGKTPDEENMAQMWIAHNDARSYIIVGDPAARLNFADDADEPPPVREPIPDLRNSGITIKESAQAMPPAAGDQVVARTDISASIATGDRATPPAGSPTTPPVTPGESSLGFTAPQPHTAPGQGAATTMLFVHGTGVREQGFNETLEEIRQGLAKYLPTTPLVVEPCLWGVRYGALLDDRSTVLPPEEASFSAGDTTPSDAEQEIALWEVLLTDPLFELRTLADEAERQANLRPGLAENLTDALAKAPAHERVAQALADAGAAELYPQALHAITGAPQFAQATAASGYPLDMFSRVAARAVVAEMISSAQRRRLPIALRHDASSRRDLVSALIVVIEPEGAFAAPSLAYKLVAHSITWFLRRRSRAERTSEIYPFPTDIIRYQRDGEPIRSYIAQRLAETSASVILAHSLGGIACVDLLARFPQPKVNLLITVGSQAPLLYQIDSLWGLRRGESLPAHFPRWVNIYDPTDYLAFLGGKMFPGRVEDLAVDNEQPFPIAHGAYWKNEKLWTHMGAALQAL